MTDETKEKTDTTTPPTSQPLPSAAIIKVQADDSYRLALEPRDFKEAQMIAAMVAGKGLFGVKSGEEAMVKIMTGRALGIPTMTALRAVYVIEGRAALEAKLKVALVLRHPECEFFRLVERTMQKSTWVGKRRGGPELPLTFTIEEAKAAGLLDRGKDEDAKKANNWNRFPADMLVARASGRLADILFPDATLGMPTTDDVYDGTYASGELVGEVVHPESKPATDAPPQAPAARDFAAEVAALLEQLKNAKTPEQQKTWRADAKKLSEAAGEPYRSQLVAAFNAHTNPEPPFGSSSQEKKS